MEGADRDPDSSASASFAQDSTRNEDVLDISGTASFAQSSARSDHALVDSSNTSIAQGSPNANESETVGILNRAFQMTAGDEHDVILHFPGSAGLVCLPCIVALFFN